MKKLYLAIAAAAVATAPSTAATTFQLDADPANSFVTVTSNPTNCFLLGTCPLTASLATPFETFTLNAGESRTFNFAKIKVGAGIGAGSATLDAQLGFLLPNATPAGTGGSASYLRVGGLFTPGVLGGSLTWMTPLQELTAADGAKFSVSFGDLHGAQFGSSVFVPVTISLISDAVPEPATWAMMIIGFGAAGAAMRLTRKTWTSSVLAA